VFSAAVNGACTTATAVSLAAAAAVAVGCSSTAVAAAAALVAAALACAHSDSTIVCSNGDCDVPPVLSTDCITIAVDRVSRRPDVSVCVHMCMHDTAVTC
jgi:cysteine synthase